jgi:integrase
MESQKKNKLRFHPNPGLTLMDQVREVLRSHHDAYRPEQTYGRWIRRDIHHFGGKTHPNRLGTTEVERFLSHLATEGQVSASTQRQALNALVVLDRDVLDTPLAATIALGLRKRQPRPPTGLTQAEVQRVLAAMTGRHALRARRLYGGSLRLLKCIRLRLQDVDVGQGLIVVRGDKGSKDRTTLLPRNSLLIIIATMTWGSCVWRVSACTTSAGRSLAVRKLALGKSTRTTSPRLQAGFGGIILIVNGHVRTLPVLGEDCQAGTHLCRLRLINSTRP